MPKCIVTRESDGGLYVRVPAGSVVDVSRPEFSGSPSPLDTDLYVPAPSVATRSSGITGGSTTYFRPRPGDDLAEFLGVR